MPRLQTTAGGVVLIQSRFVVSGDATWDARIAFTGNGIPPLSCTGRGDACREGIPLKNSLFASYRVVVE
jgi:hypothetical protein